MLITRPAEQYDVLVIGGGMVGASFAQDLARRCAGQAVSIGVIEAIAVTDQTNQPGFDARSTALAWGSRAIFEDMGLWDKLAPVVTPIKEIVVSERGRFGVTRLHHREQQVPALGYVAENRTLGNILQTALSESPTIELLAPARIATITPRADGMEVAIAIAADSQLQRLKAGLVVLADGGRSALCAGLGIAHSRKTYQQCAVISNIAVETPHANVAGERFTESGPLAVLPLPDFAGQPRCSVVWTVLAGTESALIECSEAEFIRRLTDCYGNRLGTIRKVGQRFAYPLVLSEAREQIRPHLVLLGNAAHTLHPVAGQGLNLALRDTACLSRTVSDAIRQGRQAGAMGVLQTYLDRQLPDQRQTRVFTDQLVRLFCTANPGRQLARNMGLLGLDLLPPLRKEFAQRAMGLT